MFCWSTSVGRGSGGGETASLFVRSHTWHAVHLGTGPAVNCEDFWGSAQSVSDTRFSAALARCWGQTEREREREKQAGEVVEGAERVNTTIAAEVVVVALFSLARIWGECSTIHSKPALFFLSFFFSVFFFF